MNMKVIGNTFKNLSKEDDAGISIFGVYNLEFRNNTFDNTALSFRRQGGPADYVVIENNVFKVPSVKVAVKRDMGNVTYPEHNRIAGNTFQGSNTVLLPAK
jgi:hypothetical protein